MTVNISRVVTSVGESSDGITEDGEYLILNGQAGRMWQLLHSL